MTSSQENFDKMDKDLSKLETQPIEGLQKPDSLAGLSDGEIALMEKKLVRKIDFILMPVLGVLYILNYIDRQNLAAAKLQGIMTDLNMSTQDFATAISILFVGYLPFQVPSNLIISSITRPGMYICAATIIWGTISACTAAVHTYQQLLGVRVLLGISEAVFFPGAIYLMSAWYTKNELGRRIAGLYIGQQVGNAFGGLIAAACLTLNGVHGLSGWRWLFIIEGVCTVGIGGVAAFLMPEFPYNAKILTPQQRDLAVWRLEREAGAGEASEKIGTWTGFLMSFRDPKLYALVFCNMMSQGQGSIANFFPSIVQTLGYNSTVTLLLTAPPYVFAGGFYLVMTWISDKKNRIYPLIIGCICLASITYIIPMTTENTAGRYTAMMLMPCASVGPQLLLYKTINNHLPRPIAKRAAAVALLNSVGGTSNIWSSYLWYAPPRYFAAFGALLGCAALFALTITGYKFYLESENKKLDAGGDEAKKTMSRGVTQEQIDMGWRYDGF